MKLTYKGKGQQLFLRETEKMTSSSPVFALIKGNIYTRAAKGEDAVAHVINKLSVEILRWPSQRPRRTNVSITCISHSSPRGSSVSHGHSGKAACIIGEGVGRICLAQEIEIGTIF